MEMSSDAVALVPEARVRAMSCHFKLLDQPMSPPRARSACLKGHIRPLHIFTGRNTRNPSFERSLLLFGSMLICRGVYWPEMCRFL